jgi:hypothetical protein
MTLQRNAIDIGGNEGLLTIGSLPAGVDNSSMIWVPVRLYSNETGGLSAPSFAQNEVSIISLLSPHATQRTYILAGISAVRRIFDLSGKF